MLKSALVFAALLASWDLFGHNTVKQTIKATYPLRAHGKITVGSISGDVKVTAWDQNSVELTVIKRAESQDVLDRLSYSTDSSGGNLAIKAEYPRGNCRNCDISFEIRAPRGAATSVDVSSGDVTITGMQGSVNVDSSSGEVEGKDLAGQVAIRSASGDIKLEAVRGSLYARTSSGEIRGVGLASDAELEAASGDVKAAFSDFASVKTVAISTASGSIELVLPSVADATVKAETVSGGISSSFGVRSRDRLVGESLSGTLGNGRARVTLEATNGDIRIRKG